MVAEDHPFVGMFRAANARFGDVVGLDAGVHVHFQVDADPFAAEVIANRQAALPAFRGFGAVHIFEQGFGVMPRQR
jgi:hypothetical protein